MFRSENQLFFWEYSGFFCKYSKGAGNAGIYRQIAGRRAGMGSGESGGADFPNGNGAGPRLMERKDFGYGKAHRPGAGSRRTAGPSGGADGRGRGTGPFRAGACGVDPHPDPERTGERALGKPRGTYITAELPALTDNETELEETARLIGGQLASLLPEEGPCWSWASETRQLPPTP